MENQRKKKMMQINGGPERNEEIEKMEKRQLFSFFIKIIVRYSVQNCFCKISYNKILYTDLGVLFKNKKTICKINIYIYIYIYLDWVIQSFNLDKSLVFKLDK